MMTFSVRFLREETWPDKGLPYYEALEQAGVAVPAIQGLSIRPRAAVLTLSDVGEYHRLLTNGFTFQEQHVPICNELSLTPLDHRWALKFAMLVRRCYMNQAPAPLCRKLKRINVSPSLDSWEQHVSTPV